MTAVSPSGTPEPVKEGGGGAGVVYTARALSAHRMGDTSRVVRRCRDVISGTVAFGVTIMDTTLVQPTAIAREQF